MFAPVDGVASSGASNAAGSRGPSSSADWSASPVHYFVMGPRPRWEEAHAWPPPVLAAQPLELFLGGEPSGPEVDSAAAQEVPEGRTGTLLETGPSAAAGGALRWRHDVELWKCPKVFSTANAQRLQACMQE